MVAEGLAGDASADVAAHLAACAACADDVARLKRLVTEARALKTMDEGEVASLWPEIRTRIDTAKVASIAVGEAERPRRVGWPVAAAAMLLVGVGVAGFALRRHTAQQPVVSASTNDVQLTAASDSVRLYQDEAQALLAQLELQRAMLRPDAVRAIDHDLAVVDSAIAELQDAVARDPRNSALRQLLAQSYRRKVDVLQRVGNAG